MNNQTRTLSFVLFPLLAVVALYFSLQVKGEFNFEQFFPTGDPDLAYFQEFVAEFETDDNFLLVAVERDAGIFEKDFLEKFHDFTLKSRKLPHVVKSNSITKVGYPRKTPFGFTSTPAIHRNDPAKYPADKQRILQDERFVNSLVAKDARSAVVVLKLVDNIQVNDSRVLMSAMDSLIATYGFEDYHYLGRPNFQVEFISLQMRELLVSAVVSGLLVTLVMFLIFRKGWTILIAVLSLVLGMLFFTGMMGATGRTLNLMSALYPVLLIIVGTSDVVHFMSKYMDELRRGKGRYEAIRITIKEIGMATLLTSTTTAVGFLTLMSSRILPIREFGLNSAVGVMIAYLVALGFTTALLSLFGKEQLVRQREGEGFWERWMGAFYLFTKRHPRRIAVGMSALFLICLYGLSLVTTNYSIRSNLPRGQKISLDYIFFEEEYAGFRPFEVAVLAKDTFQADDFEVLLAMDRLEKHLASYPAIQSVNSLTTVYKSINQALHAGRDSMYIFPERKVDYLKCRKYLDKLPDGQMDVLLSRDGSKARISARILDVGSDTIQAIGQRIDRWIADNADAGVVEFRRTGTGVLFDKNEEYIRDSILEGLGAAILVVSLLMTFLFRNIKMLLISLVPNVMPLLVAGALLGYAGIELESGVAIVFAVVFGIAVDDTIHFLSKYKLSRSKGLDIEQSLHITFVETGKAICLTSVILFFGFLVMLFSINPPSVTVGIIISVTLASALFSDLLTIPLLLRWWRV